MCPHALQTSHSRSTAAVTALAALLLGAALAGCSSASSDASTAASAVAPASTSAEGQMGTDEMRTLCDQMIADALSPEDATTLAEQKGFVARVGTIDGAPQALTMDLREDRFTFEVAGGVVTACTYG